MKLYLQEIVKVIDLLKGIIEGLRRCYKYLGQDIKFYTPQTHFKTKGIF